MPKPVLLVRASGNQADAKALETLGIASVSDPYLSIVAAGDSTAAIGLLSKLQTADWLIATSANGVRFWAELVGQETLAKAITDGAARGLKFAAVGKSTAMTLESLGANNVFIPSVAYSQRLAQEIIDLEPAGSSPVAVLPVGNLAMTALNNQLTAAGWQLEQAEVYQTSSLANPPVSAAKLVAGEYSAVVLRSPSAARAVFEFAGAFTTPVICGGQTTAKTATQLGLQVAGVADSSEPTDMAQTVINVLSNFDSNAKDEE